MFGFRAVARPTSLALLLSFCILVIANTMTLCIHTMRVKLSPTKLGPDKQHTEPAEQALCSICKGERDMFPPHIPRHRLVPARLGVLGEGSR